MLRLDLPDFGTLKQLLGSIEPASITADQMDAAQSAADAFKEQYPGMFKLLKSMLAINDQMELFVKGHPILSEEVLSAELPFESIARAVFTAIDLPDEIVVIGKKRFRVHNRDIAYDLVNGRREPPMTDSIALGLLVLLAKYANLRRRQLLKKHSKPKAKK